MTVYSQNTQNDEKVFSLGQNIAYAQNTLYDTVVVLKVKIILYL